MSGADALACDALQMLDWDYHAAPLRVGPFADRDEYDRTRRDVALVRTMHALGWTRNHLLGK